MMRDEVEALLKRVAYRPNFLIEYQPEGYYQAPLGETPAQTEAVPYRWVETQEDTGPHRVTFLMYVPDAYDDAPRVAAVATGARGWSGRQLYRQDLDLITVQFTRIVPEGVCSSDQFFVWVKKQIDELEDHERDEWFKIDGVRIIDAHQVVYVATEKK